MNGFKCYLHARCCTWPATSAAFTAKVAAWPMTQSKRRCVGARRPLVTLHPENIKANVMKFYFVPSLSLNCQLFLQCEQRWGNIHNVTRWSNVMHLNKIHKFFETENFCFLKKNILRQHHQTMCSTFNFANKLYCKFLCCMFIFYCSFLSMKSSLTFFCYGTLVCILSTKSKIFYIDLYCSRF